jgi:hypothetical protein
MPAMAPQYSPGEPGVGTFAEDATNQSVRAEFFDHRAH